MEWVSGGDNFFPPVISVYHKASVRQIKETLMEQSDLKNNNNNFLSFQLFQPSCRES